MRKNLTTNNAVVRQLTKKNSFVINKPLRVNSPNGYLINSLILYFRWLITV